MELKKNPKYDLRRYSGLFINIGLIISLLLTITAFNLNFGDEKIADLGSQSSEEEETIEIPPTDQLPPPPPPSVTVPEIQEVEQVEEEEEEVSFEEPEEDTEVKDAPPPVEEEEEEVTEEPFLIVEQSAEPAGGMGAFMTHVGTYLQKNYPERAKRAQTQGKVYVYFVIEKDGTPTNFQILKGIGMGCDEAAIEAIKTFGKWSPPKQRGRPVRQAFRIPINFKLQ